MINIVIPMAGEGTRIKIFGIDVPKPLLNIGGETMAEHSIKSLNIDGRFIFITKKYNDKKYNQLLSKILKKNKQDSIEIMLDKVQYGASDSVLYAEEYINNEDPLIILNCDQKINWNANDFLKFVNDENCDGAVVVFDSQSDKYSYAKTVGNKVIEIKEKVVISNNALAGIHYWKHGRDFVDSAKKVLALYHDKKIKECYISNTYSFLLKDKNILTYKIKSDDFFNLGEIEDIYKYNKLFNLDSNLRGRSGAQTIVLGEKTIKVGNDRVGSQGEWIYNNYNTYLPRVYSFLENSYVMETLNKFELKSNKEDFVKEIIEILKYNFWNSPPDNYIDHSEHIKRLYDISYSFSIFDKMMKIKESINWEKLTYGKVHGDPILDNIMFRNNIVIIDPIPSTKSIPDLISVDLGRILQSAMGYENDVYLDNRLDGCNLNFLNNMFSKEDLYAAKYWCIFHFLRSAKYLKDEELKRVENKIFYLIENFDIWGPAY